MTKMTLEMAMIYRWQTSAGLNQAYYSRQNLPHSTTLIQDTLLLCKLMVIKYSNLVGDQNDSGHGDDSQMADLGRAQSSILFQTKFTNTTKREQEYTLKTEKTTRSSATTEIETSYTRGIEMSVNLKTPGTVFSELIC